MAEYWTDNDPLNSFIDEARDLCNPDDVYICDGSKKEFDRICQELVDSGVAKPLSKRKGSFYFRSDPSDVARVEDQTFICTEKEEDAGPTNNWADPVKMRTKMNGLFKGCMKGRTMYVVPYLMGPPNGTISHAGIELSDSPYVVINMYLMTRMGNVALDWIAEKGEFIKGLHSVGQPLQLGEKDSKWPCNQEKYIVHMPEMREIFSYGSGYGGNALLGKKCFALRIASYMARQAGWMAEHMLILKAVHPDGRVKHIAAAFPSACGKTNLAMLKPTLPGWNVTCIGDDIAWMYVGKDGKLYGINPESGFFGVAPGTSINSNPYAMETISENTLFTNVALTDDGDVWWEGMTDKAPEGMTTWKGERYDPASGEKGSHPNARFTVSMRQCPIFDPDADKPEGVPIDAILFGGRRAKLAPLIVEAKDWRQGVFYGASLTSERTAAAAGKVGELRNDPMAMTPFCGYHMGDYFSHWLSMEQPERKLPQIYAVNWFRKNSAGKFIWPGFGENARVFEWIFDRIDGKVEGNETPIGVVPKDINRDGLEVPDEDLKELLSVDKPAYKEEMTRLREYFKIFGDRLPRGISDELDEIEERLK